MSTWNDVMTPLVIMSGTDQNTLPLAQLNFQTQFGTNYNLAFASYLLDVYKRQDLPLYRKVWMVLLISGDL